jgi:hypothetical protein
MDMIPDRLMMMCRVCDGGWLLQKLMNAYASYLYGDRCQLYGYNLALATAPT